VRFIGELFLVRPCLASCSGAHLASIVLEENCLLLLTSPGRLNSEGKVKDAIVSILSNEWPLTLKEIYFSVVRRHCLRVSHQAVHKALKQLVESKVVAKKERRYRLNIEWIKGIKRFGENLEEAYSQPEKEVFPKTLKDLETVQQIY